MKFNAEAAGISNTRKRMDTQIGELLKLLQSSFDIKKQEIYSLHWGPLEIIEAKPGQREFYDNVEKTDGFCSKSLVPG